MVQRTAAVLPPLTSMILSAGNQPQQPAKAPLELGAPILSWGTKAHACAVDAPIDTRRQQACNWSRNRPEVIERYAKGAGPLQPAGQGQTILPVQIVVGPKLKMPQCGLPKEMALNCWSLVMKELVVAVWLITLRARKWWNGSVQKCDAVEM